MVRDSRAERREKRSVGTIVRETRRVVIPTSTN